MIGAVVTPKFSPSRFLLSCRPNDVLREPRSRTISVSVLETREPCSHCRLAISALKVMALLAFAGRTMRARGGSRACHEHRFARGSATAKRQVRLAHTIDIGTVHEPCFLGIGLDSGGHPSDLDWMGCEMSNAIQQIKLSYIERTNDLAA